MYIHTYTWYLILYFVLGVVQYFSYDAFGDIRLDPDVNLKYKEHVNRLHRCLDI